MVINVHITPRERERLIREERQRRRIARLLQVRQQTAENAQLIREQLLNEKKSNVDRIRKELRRSISEKVTEVASVVRDTPRIPLPSDSTSASTTASKAHPTRTPRRHRHVFTKEDAKKALERGRRAHERLLAERAAARKKAADAIRLRREAAEEANLFNKANPTTR
ncbi:hypothetical protein ANCCAN_20806 [Ancylostoma caninum]|uniref:Uncharacterized protein n=1 Tax=Ancylostoma caninum TaxID=29170 RepID=A0A368FPB3_ANCCA|nr:hypothetical protein ANCCAN_20806 [Ancylostoma caninum]